MRNRSRDYCYIYLLILLETLQPPTCHSNVTGDAAHRVKRELAVAETLNPDGAELSNVGRSVEYDADVAASRSSRGLDDVSAEAKPGKSTARERDSKEAAHVNAGLDKYTDQDERSSLYDDYEAKDIAKRGAPGGPEDYEEEDEDSNVMGGDVAAVVEQGSLDEGTAEKGRAAREGDARVKRDQSRRSVLQALDKPESASNQPPDSKQSRRSVSGTAGESNDDAAREYEKRVDEKIQRKIDSIKEEIQRDIEAQRRINDIEDNNARFEELRHQERDEDEDEKRLGDSETEPIEKRQTVVKRSIRERLSSRGQVRKRAVTATHDQPAAGRTSSKRFLKKKRDRVRQTFLVNDDDDDRRRERRRSRGYASSLNRIDVRPENELFIMPQDLNSHLHTDNRMDQAPSSVASEGENNEGKGHPNRLVSLAESSLGDSSPRLAREYKEAFGGLQSEPGSALARFKRIKRVLGGSDAEI